MSLALLALPVSAIAIGTIADNLHVHRSAREPLRARCSRRRSLAGLTAARDAAGRADSAK